MMQQANFRPQVQCVGSRGLSSCGHTGHSQACGLMSKSSPTHQRQASCVSVAAAGMCGASNFTGRPGLLRFTRPPPVTIPQYSSSMGAASACHLRSSVFDPSCSGVSINRGKSTGRPSASCNVARSGSSSGSTSRQGRGGVRCQGSSSSRLAPPGMPGDEGGGGSSNGSGGGGAHGGLSSSGVVGGVLSERLQRWWGEKTRGSGFLDNKYDAEIWAVAIPALAAMLLDPVMGVMNSAIVGRIGTQQLGAVSVGSLVVSFCTYLFSFLLFLTTPEIAAAMVKGDTREVSRISSKGFWLSGILGVATAATLMLGGPVIISMMRTPEPAVAEYAMQYIAVRAWGIPAVLAGFVAIGTYRGFKDTRTPLYAAMGAAATSFVLNLLFIYGFGWGVWGSALATTAAQYVSSISLCILLVGKRMLQPVDFLRPPSLVSVLPLLRRGLVLTLRNIISFGMVMYASVLCVRAGSAYQASFEVVRQVWIVTIQFFECLNVATQTHCATYLGGSDRASAAGVLQRLLFLGVSIGAGLGVVLACCQQQVANLFTNDPLVMQQVMLTLPLVCALFPLDAAASILDGSLLAAKQTDYMSYVQIMASVLQYGTLVYLSTHDLVNNLTIWAVLKVLSLFRCAGGVYRGWFSKHSAYKFDGVMSTVPTESEQRQMLLQTSQRTDANGGESSGSGSGSGSSRGNNDADASNSSTASSTNTSNSIGSPRLANSMGSGSFAAASHGIAPGVQGDCSSSSSSIDGPGSSASSIGGGPVSKGSAPGVQGKGSSSTTTSTTASATNGTHVCSGSACADLGARSDGNEGSPQAATEGLGEQARMGSGETGIRNKNTGHPPGGPKGRGAGVAVEGSSDTNGIGGTEDGRFMHKLNAEGIPVGRGSL